MTLHVCNAIKLGQLETYWKQCYKRTPIKTLDTRPEDTLRKVHDHITLRYTIPSSETLARIDSKLTLIL